MSDQTQPRPELAEIQNLPVPELSDRLAGLSAEDLAQLRDLESATDKPRSGALAAIDAAAKVLAEGNEPPAPPAGAGAGAAKPAAAKPAAAAAKAPAWQGRDYDGPLTIPQAEWRRHNIKPVQGARTK